MYWWCCCSERRLAKPSSPLSSLPKTFANVFSAIVGAGVLGLPYTFSGVLMFLECSCFSLFLSLLTIACRKLEDNDSLGDLGFAVCGSVGRFSVNAMIGFCVGYLIFIANTLVFLFNARDSTMGITPKSFYIWTCFPFQLGLNSIPTLTHLAPLSIFADVLQIAAMAVVMVQDGFLIMEQHQRPPLNTFTFGDFSIVLYGLGVAFQGVAMALPLESETKDKPNFGKILALSRGFISLAYASFGVMGYFAFADETKDIITTNFGKGLLSYVSICSSLFL